MSLVFEGVIDGNLLIQKLAKECDARAVIYIYDQMKSKALEITSETWNALRKLEKVAKEKKLVEKYSVPVKVGALAPGRRIHKICKGVVLHERSKLAKNVMPLAIKWVTENKNVLPTERSQQVQMLVSELKIDKDTARGVITKLKQKGLLN